ADAPAEAGLGAGSLGFPARFAEAALALPPEAEDVSVHVEDLGDWADAAYDPDFGALAFEAATARQWTLAWHAPVEIHARGAAAAALSGWVLNGLKRFSNCAPSAGGPTRATLGIEVRDAAGVRSVTLYAGAAEVARGSRSGDGAVALAEANGSGLSGSVTLAYAGDVAPAEAALDLRWPASYQLHVVPEADAPPSFPRTPEATFDDDGRSNRFAYTSPAAEPGSYSAAVLPVSDTGVPAESAEAAAFELPALPAPPADLAYSGGDADATELSWTASATPGASYRVYDSALNGAVNLAVPAATHAAGSGTLSLTLPALGGGPGPGVRRVLVRAVADGAEERNAEALRIEYDADGARVAPRPNVPRIRSIEVSGGRTVTVKALAFEDRAAAPSASALLYMAPVDEAIDYGTPAGTEEFGEEVGGVREAEVAATAPGDGWFRVAVRAAAAGGATDAGVGWERVFVSAAAPAGASVVARAGRG
ncbi:MAG: hypothetical protein KIS92_25605, partial [Planctomycetota bacterium]|nr:hypothetical protein [Planctomycetota bacterium]